MLRKLPILPFCLVALLAMPATSSAQGLYISGAGGLSQGMAGATTAAPLDVGSALQWNPAAMSGMKNSEVLLGGVFLYPQTSVTSKYRIEGPLGNRTFSREGVTSSDSGLPLASASGFVYKPDNSPFTYGMGINFAAAGGVNLPGDPSNPIFSPSGPLRQFILGPSFAAMTIVQVTPSVSYQVTDRLAIGAGPVIDMCIVSFSPAFFGKPDDANGDGVSTFPNATNSRPFWGGGFRVGALYNLTETFDVGFGYTSQQWLETWKFHSRDEVGNPQDLLLKASLPAIYSLGFAFKGIERTIISLDLRYMDYANTLVFGQKIVDGGLGWQSIFCTAVGAQYQVTDKLAIRAGYLYNQNPVLSTNTIFNVQAPVINQHSISAGFTYQVTDSISSSMAYTYGVPNSIQGDSFQPRDTGTKIDMRYQALSFGLNFAIGAPAVRTSPMRGEVIESFDAIPVTKGAVPYTAPVLATQSVTK